MKTKKRVMICSVGAGSGHLRAAQALESVCRDDARVEEVIHVDALEYTNKIFQEVYSKGYLEAVKKAPALWSLAFEETDVPWRKQRSLMMMQRLNAQPLLKEIKRFDPDVCICTHFMPADIISHLIREDRLRGALGVVVTDYYVHATWMVDVFTRYFVGKEESARQLEVVGFPSARITVSGIPIDPCFAEQRDRAALLKAHNLQPDRPIVLLSAGTFGVMPAADIFKMLEMIQTPAQVVIVCGKNEKLKAAMEAHPRSGGGGALTFSILGFTDKMHELMYLADLFIGKPGGLSTSECMASRLPMVIWDPIPGQEQYNTNYLLESGAAVAPDTAATIGFKVDSILSDPDRLRRMQECASAIAHPEAARTVVNTLLERNDEAPVKVFKEKSRG